MEKFIEKISQLNIECMILDDCEINPNEIIVLVKEKKNLVKNMQNEGISWIISNGDKKRYINIVTYSELGISQWTANMVKNGIYISDNIQMPSEEDNIAFFLYYVFLFAKTHNWLCYNATEILMQRLDVSDLGDLESWLAGYIGKYNYNVRLKNIVKLPAAITEQLAPLQKVRVSLGQFRLKLFRKLNLKILGKRASLYNRFTRSRYIDYLKKTGAVEKDWTLINHGGTGSSGCTLIKEKRDGNTFFLKGNEMPLYEGLKNEIAAQKKLLKTVGNAADWFLPMSDCDPELRWIRYEYVTWELLSKYKNKHSFTKEELAVFGEYLVMILDKLYEMNIVHNDFRSENMFVRTKADGTLDKIVLTDFGCSSIDGSFPWKKNTYWGKYFSRGVCGKMRYNENIVDDAASALLVYLSVGGNSEDSSALKMKERIGRLFFVCE